MSLPLVSLLLLSFVAIVLAGSAAPTAFCVIGDFGGQSAPPYTTAVQLAVAGSIGPVCQGLNAQFTVSVGDNIYDNGTTSEYDPRFQVSYEQIYTHPFTQKPWYLVPGNRDYYSSNITAEIAYTQHSSRWKMPSLYYEQTFNDANGVPLLQLLLVDSWDLTSASKGPQYPPQDLAGKGQAVLNYLRSRLSDPANNYVWRIVVSHYPIYSSGAHGPNNTDLITRLEPILRQYKTDAYFAGHDHSLQHLQKPCPPSPGYQCSGMYNFYMFGPGSEAENSELGYSLDPSPRLFQFPTVAGVQGKGGFGAVILNTTHMTIQFYRDDAIKLYEYTQTAQRVAAPPVQPPTVAPPPTTGVAPPPTTTGVLPPTRSGDAATAVVSAAALLALAAIVSF